MKQLVKVHMLPTTDTSVICKSIAGLHYTESMISKIPNYINQHLYFTSDEKIKRENWFIPEGHINIHQCKEINKINGDIESLNGLCYDKNKCRKIIATTDKSLTIIDYSRSLDQEIIYLPQIPQQFIEDYCKVGGIDEVYLEYITHKSTSWCENAVELDIPILKLDSNNCVITHPIEPKLYTKEEVLRIMEIRLNSFGICTSQFENNNWIKENLK